MPEFSSSAYLTDTQLSRLTWIPAIAEYEGRGPGQRGRRPCPWRYHAVRYRVVAETRRTRRARRGRPAKTEPSPMEAGYRLVVEVTTLANLEEDNGWAVLATTRL